MRAIMKKRKMKNKNDTTESLEKQRRQKISQLMINED